MKKLGEYQRFRDALAIVESGDNPNAIGDGGRAFGRWQMHPAWVLRYRVDVSVSDTWDSYLQRCLGRFFFSPQFTLEDDLTKIAMEYHVGHPVSVGNHDWDDDYAEKFTRALKQVEARASSSVV